MTRVLVVGPAGSYSETCAEVTHGSHVRPVALARAFASLGCAVDLLDLAADTATLRAVRDQDLARGLAAYDAICIAGIAGLWRLRSGGHEAALRAHPAVALMVDTIYGPPDGPADLAFARVLIATSPSVADFYAPIRRGLVTEYAPWGCTEMPELPSPWPDAAQRVLFAGIVYPRFVDVLNGLAQTLAAEVWVAGIFSIDGPLGGISPAQRERLLHPRVFLATDVLPRTSLGDGPVRYRDVCRMAQHATIGLNLVPRSHSTVGTSSKVYDYLAAGLRVVSESSPACDVDVSACGVVVPWNDPPALTDAVRSVLDQPEPDRSALAAHALARCSWETAARLVLSRA